MSISIQQDRNRVTQHTRQDQRSWLQRNRNIDYRHEQRLPSGQALHSAIQSGFNLIKELPHRGAARQDKT
jgi:hypothetical protein